MVQGPKLRSQLTLDIDQYQKNIALAASMTTLASKRMVGATKDQKAAQKELIAVDKAVIAEQKALIAQAKERIRVMDRTTASQKKQTAATKQATHSFGTFSKALGTSITLWYTARTAVFAFRRALEGVLGIYVKGIKEIDDFRLATIGATAIMIPSIESGTTAAEKMAMAWEHNKNMLLELELVAAKHITTGKSIQEVYTGIVIAQIFPKKADVENMARIADFITIYTKGQQLGKQLLQEVRGLMDGQVRVTNKLAYMLNQIIPGGLKKNLELWKAQGRNAEGELVVLERIQYYLGNIGILQGEILGSASTWRNTLETISIRLLREATLPAYNEVTNLLERITRSLITQDLVYTEQAQILKAIVEEGWERVKNVVEGFVGGPLATAEEMMDRILLDLGVWVTDAGPAAISLGESMRTTAEAIYSILKNIKNVVAVLFAMRAPVWVFELFKVIASIGTAAGATAAGLASLTGGMIAFAYVLVEKLGANFETAETMTYAFNNELGRTDKLVQSVRRAIVDLGTASEYLADFFEVGGSTEITEEPKFKDPGEDLAKYVKEEEKNLLATSARMWKNYWAKLKAYGEEGLAKRKELADALIAEAENFAGVDLLDPYIKNQEKMIKAYEKMMKEVAQIEEETLAINLSAYGGYYKEILTYKAELYATELAMLDAKNKGEWDKVKALKEKELALEKGMSRSKVDLYMTTAQTSVSAGAEALRMIAEHNKKWFRWYQAFAVAEIAINTAIAIMRAYSELGPIAGSIAAAFIGALGAVQAAAVLAQEPPEELAAGGVSPTGFTALQGVYGRPTYMMAEKQGRPEAVVPLDKYVVSEKDSEGGGGDTHNYYISALDARSFRDFAKRNPGPFREQFTKAIESNDKRIRAAVKTAVR